MWLTLEEIRAAFEAEMERIHFNVSRYSNTGEYVNKPVQTRWLVAEFIYKEMTK